MSFFSGNNLKDTDTFAMELQKETWFKSSGTDAANLSKENLKKWLRKNARDDKFQSRHVGVSVLLDTRTFSLFFAEYQKGTSAKKVKTMFTDITAEEKSRLDKMKDNPIIAQMLASLDKVIKDEKTE